MGLRQNFSPTLHLMTISRQHIEFSVNNARNGSTTVRALHPNPIRVFRNGEAEGALLSKLGTTTAKLRAGDLIEIGDVRGLIKDGQVFTFRLCSGTYQPATTTSPGRPAAAAAPPPAKRRCSTPVAAAAAAAAVPPDDSVPQEAAPLAPAAGAERETELAAAAPQHEVAAGVKPQGASIHTPMTLPGAANGAAISGGELATKQLTKPDYPSSAAQEPRRLSRDLREATESDPRVPANGSQSASLSRNQPQSAAIGGPSHLRAGRAGGLVRGPRPLERACISIFGRGAPLGRAAREAAPRAHPPDERCHQRNQWVLISANQRSSSSSPST